ncbi:hypothetical protein [Polaromonas sp.]|uniref:hypothetical protein n=1 Tax=Polaromonas sp. TaxID=1869339 RepID=UPI003567C9FC
MSDLHTPATARARLVHLVDAEHLLNRLTGLARQREELGRVSEAVGVRKAIELIQRDLACRPRRACWPPD